MSISGETIASFCVGSLLGYLVFTVLGAEKAGDSAWGMMKFVYKRKEQTAHIVHIHHWLWSLVLLALLVWFLEQHRPSLKQRIQDHCFGVPATEALVYGILAGGMVHGLSYSDWHHIVYTEPC